MSRNERNISLFWITLCTLVWFIESGNGLQGVPTWMCLGIKSPFLEFKSEFEFLSNNSISLNISNEGDSPLKHRKSSLQNLGNFINPIVSSNSQNKDEKPFQGINNTTFSIQSDILDGKDSRRQQEKHLYQLQQQQIEELQTHKLNKSTTNKILMDIIKPIVTDGHRREDHDNHNDNSNNNNNNNNNNSHGSDTPTIQIIANSNGDNHHEQMDSGSHNYQYDDAKDRKYIIPLALKTTLIDSRDRSPPMPTPAPPPPPGSNIDDLKRHILMLQNFTANDKNFQNKFVVFPKFQTTTSTTTTTVRTTTMPFPMTQYRTKPSINMPLHNSQILRDVSYPYNRPERVTFAPQVFLQNDQTPESTAEQALEENRKANRKNGTKKPKKDRKNRKNNNNNNNNGNNIKKANKNIIMTTTTSSTTAAPVPLPPNNKNIRRLNKNPNRDNRRKKLEEQQQQQQQQKTPIRYERTFNGSHTIIAGVSQTATTLLPLTTTTATLKALDTPYIINLNDKHIQMNNNDKKLSRSIRSRTQGKRRNQNKMQRDTIPDTMSNNGNGNNNNNNSNKNDTVEKIDLNPKHCYEVGGLSRGQQKLCEQYTSIMPAISRGARAAIQECQHQFQNRRWNCSTVEDNTVFGPVSSIGSPEMAFVNALAAATTASFIARACRDGQLSSCGCSRSARPKQLHEDWTWGGCGDDLEFGYKFSQTFIDIREKERKRGARGLVTVPTKHEQKLLGNETAVDVAVNVTTTLSPEEQLKADEIAKLQQKISHELLNSNLEKKEMNELQEKINKEIQNSKLFNNNDEIVPRKQKGGRYKTANIKARTLMNLHNNEAGRRAMIKKSRITCKCHGVSGSCSLITCWQQLTSIREIGDYLREQYEQATQVKMNKRSRLQVKDSSYKVPTALDLVYLDESPDWCRANKQLQWPGTHGRKCNKTSSGLDSCSILCCGRGYNTKKIVIHERCNCKFQWCCHVKCDTCTKVVEEYTCK